MMVDLAVPTATSKALERRRAQVVQDPEGLLRAIQEERRHTQVLAAQGDQGVQAVLLPGSEEDRLIP